MTQETAKTLPRPVDPPTSHPYLSPLTKLDRLAWARFPDAWRPTWVGDIVRGLAVQVTPSPLGAGANGKPWSLRLYHEASGLSFASTRPGGHPIEATPKDLRAMIALRDAMLDLPVDWTKVDPREDCSDLPARVDALVAEQMPAAREWRAWRYGKRGPLEYKWYKTAAAAEKWARQFSSWWLVESWRVPPMHAWERETRPDFEGIGRGVLPPDCDLAWWTPGASVVRKAVRASDGTVDVSAYAHGCDGLSPNVIGNLESFAWRPPEHQIRNPTGELVPGEQALVDAELALIDERGWSTPTPRGLRALAADVLRRGRPLLAGPAQSTSDALKDWRYKVRDAKRAYVAEARRSPTSRWQWSERQRERLQAWVLLLACIHRDRQAAAEGRPRFELPSRYHGGELEILRHEGGLACAEHRCSLGWSWMTWRTRPAVSWTPGSAWAVVGERVDGFFESTLQEHGRRDWALAAWEERRASGK